MDKTSQKKKNIYKIIEKHKDILDSNDLYGKNIAPVNNNDKMHFMCHGTFITTDFQIRAN